GVTRENVAQGLANSVNGDLSTPFQAQTGTGSVTITGPAFDADLFTPYNGAAYIYTVQASDTLATVAAQLAARLDALSNIDATSATNSINVLGSSSAVFTLGFSVSAGSNGRASIAGTPLGFTVGGASERAWTTAEIRIDDPGTPQPPVGAVWTVFLDGVGFEYTRKEVPDPSHPGQTMPQLIGDVTAGLADAINQSGGRFATMYTSATVKLSGTPHAGDVWTLTLRTGASGSPLSVSYTVLGTDSLSSVANALADAVDALTGFSVDTAADD